MLEEREVSEDWSGEAKKEPEKSAQGLFGTYLIVHSTISRVTSSMGLPPTGDISTSVSEGELLVGRKSSSD
jgi:hypothetical protein